MPVQPLVPIAVTSATAAASPSVASSPSSGMRILQGSSTSRLSVIIAAHPAGDLFLGGDLVAASLVSRLVQEVREQGFRRTERRGVLGRLRYREPPEDLRRLGELAPASGLLSPARRQPARGGQRERAGELRLVGLRVMSGQPPVDT